MIGLVLACVTAAASVQAQSILRPPFFGLGRPKPQPPLVFAYHGWRVDASRAGRVQSPDKTVRAVEAQLDLVERQGLAPDILALMRTTPILVVPDSGESVAYGRAGGVTLNARRLDAKKPLALLGLLEAYADRGLPGAPANAEVARYRREAIAAHVWPKTALMLRSDGDFFALTAGAYLVGATTREPYTRANLKKTQGGYYQWLANLFDRGQARR
jgi:hypothetical protein